MRNYIANRQKRWSDIPAPLLSSACQTKLTDAIARRSGKLISDYYYSHLKVKDKLQLYFGKKCVYCEASPISTSAFRSEHYRPKNNLKDSPLHRGYYWLGYEWTNLLQSCEKCNGKKLNSFPLSEEITRVDDTNSLITEKNPIKEPLSQEKRLLLHPELDWTEKHFSFHPDGRISGKSEEGEKSIFYYDLNRDDLIAERKKLRDDIFNRIIDILRIYERNIKKSGIKFAEENLQMSLEDILKEMMKNTHISKPFSLFYLFMLKDFKLFFIDFLPITAHQNVVQNIYNQFPDKLFT